MLGTSLHPQHARILSRIRTPVLPGILRREGQIVACGLGVLDGQLFGIFDMVTLPEYRRRGCAHELPSSMLSWARRRGARSSYPQVLGANDGAVRLYSRLGFGGSTTIGTRRPRLDLALQD
ncbi:MAG: GNAT family N-acetyltransferase [Gemmatimonas sp.]|nr:GNAT family N-acetyltransferase [Gemmatimonas sp.]